MSSLAQVSASPAVPASALLGLAGSRSFARPANDHHASSTALGRLLAEAFEAFDRDPGAARFSLSQAFALLDARSAPATGPTAPRAPDLGVLAPWQAKKAAAHIEAHLDGPIQISELAALARLSRSYFSRAFKATFRSAPQAYIQDRRIALAQDLMLTTEEPLCAIALACGFSDQSHLSRIFRRLSGASPNAWRRARRAAPAAEAGVSPIRQFDA